MAASAGGTIAKFLLVVCNAIFLLTGLALLAVGTWLIADATSFLNTFDILREMVAADRYLSYAAYVMIATGAFVIIVAGFGFFGSISENVFLLSVYIFLVSIVLTLMLACGILGVIFRDKITRTLDATAYCHMKGHKDERCPDKEPAPDNFRKIFRLIQYKFECCGVMSPGDYNTSHMIHRNGAKLSWTCCKMRRRKPKFSTLNAKFGEFESNLPADTTAFDNFPGCVSRTDEKAYYNVGCSQKLREWIRLYAPIIIGLGLALAAFEMFVIIFAVCLCRTTRRDTNSYA